MSRAARGVLVLGIAICLHCVPSLGPGDALVTSTRVLAIRAIPAEAVPGTKVTFTALVAGPGGTEAASVAWSFCTAPKPLTEDNIVPPVCVATANGPLLVAAGSGATVTVTTPSKGCSVFGPDVGSMGLRPRDPDVTGGYYQPLRAALAGTDAAVDLVRIRCDLADADAMSATAFAKAYRDNQNPTLLPLTATGSGSAAPLTAIPKGEHVTLRASWPASSAETFAYFDAADQRVATQREGMQVSWYCSGGALDTESTGRAANDAATTSDDGWTAPDTTATVHLWVVLRDSRGGVDFVSQDVLVRD